MSECLLCRSELGNDVFPYSTRFNDRTYRYRNCVRCGSSTIDPLPGPDELAAMYRQDEYHGVFYDQPEEEPSTVLDSFLSATGDGPHTLLDFGCGSGQFLKAAKALGFRAEGVEIDPVVRLKAAQASGCPVHALEELEQGSQRFDVIHLGDVLEHLPDPAGSMRALEALLSKNGQFFLEGPLETNPSLVRTAGVLFGSVRANLGRQAVGTYPPYHLFQTNARAQRAFFEERLGYKIDRFEVWETGWPYRSTVRIESIGARIRDVIGRASVLVAGVAGPSTRLGNRFAALLRPSSL
ncbi:class I SAM-dependent methyltransferase [Sphingomonas glaciei]|uniref:Class I SAM-dependent methyltransferase n=1 Tax=Sphingomonas glaciei TaxID=2938948 RepID=A0ABY5MVB6_9SPHN|nr:class I SAM-dependent methyltransferase [Sphingomonas glaciei]UUR08420.1 class I SAM-dependent methyltransferase [Sphingomonas glaciei]